MKLSIIVPVYNVEKYIHQCLDSCISQDIDKDNYEIIIVNDGSQDNSVSVAKHYEKNHTNIRIVNRDNGGLSAARNTGLQNAKGKYVWFVDSDDWIEKYILKDLIYLLDTNNLDALCFGVKCFHNQTHIDSSMPPTDKDNVVMKGKDFVCDVNIIPAAWGAIYRREFLLENKLMFYEGILHEDEEFTPRAYFLTNNIMYTHRHVYYYRQREGSIMKSSRDMQRAIDYLKIADSLYSFASSNVSKDTHQYYYFIQRINQQVTQSLYYNKNEHVPYDEYRKKDYFPLEWWHLQCSLRDKLKYLLISISPKLYCSMLRNFIMH